MTVSTLAVSPKKGVGDVIEIGAKNSTTQALFGEWVYKKTYDGHVLTWDAASKFLASLLDKDVKYSDTLQWISKARLYCEKEKRCTLWNVRGLGWRVADDRETAVYYGKCMRRTIASAERTCSLQAIVKQQYIPDALREVLRGAEGGARSLVKTRQRYLEVFAKFLDKRKQREENELDQVKLIEAKR